MTTYEFAWRYLSDNSDTLGVLVALAASLLAFAGLCVSARALGQQSRALDIAAYLDIRHRLADALRRAREAPASEIADVEWRELFNLLEGISGLYKSNRLGRATGGAVKKELIGAIHAVESAAVAKDRMAKALSPASPFAALKWFHGKYQAEIARYASAL